MKLNIVFLLCFWCQNVLAYTILGVALLPSKSHYYIGHSLFKSLAEEGHSLTVITPFLEKTPIKNYKEIFLENSLEEFQKSNTSLQNGHWTNNVETHDIFLI